MLGAPGGGVLLPPGVGFPPPFFQVVGVGVKERGERREGRRGAALPLVQFGLVIGGAQPVGNMP